jgi:hypothetical protein
MLHQVTVFLQKIKTYIAAPVPADMAACEFDCRESDCQTQNWETCDRRLQKAHAIKQLSEVVISKSSTR